jgi:hypothetical protein
MTVRRAIFWFVLVPLTIAVWAQFLPPCVFGCTPEEPVKSYTFTPEPEVKPANWGLVICPIARPCWKDGKPIVGAL